MKKMLLTTCTLLTLFTLTGAVLAQQKPAAKKSTTMKTEVATPTKSGLTLEGQITAVNSKAMTFTLTGGKNKTPMTLSWNETTKIMEAGHAVKPSALVAGANVTVDYMRKDGKDWATSILISHHTQVSKKK